MKKVILNLSNRIVPEEYYGFIYKTIFPNEKIYIGQTTKRVHINYLGTGGSKLKNAFDYYKRENCKREILRFCKSQKELSSLEKFYILKFRSNEDEFGYNIIEGDANFKYRNPMKMEGMGIYAASRVDKEKKRQSTLDWYKNNGTEHLKGENNPMFGIKREDYKPPFQGRKHSEESKRKIGESGKGRKHTEESKKKMSESAKRAHKLRKNEK